MIYTPSSTCADFMMDESFFRTLLGPLGSGKTLTCIVELFRRACEQAPDSEGIRPTRFAAIRNTRQQLIQTCLADARAFLGPLAHFRVSETTLQIRFMLPDGTRVESDILFIPLENPDDARRVLSLNLTGVWVSEFREIDFALINPLLGRCGRYPSGARVKPTWFGGIAESNPYAEGSEWHKALVSEPVEGWVQYRQPSGLAPNAENLAHLPGGRNYYLRLVQGATEDWITVHVHGEYGEDVSGQTVFRRSFTRSRHAVDGLLVQPLRTIVVGLDLGRTPTAVFTQEDARGRTLFLQEIVSEDMALHQFCSDLLRPALGDTRYGGCTVVVVYDPSGMAKSQLREESAQDILNIHGFLAHPAPTNYIAPRLRAIEGLLLQNRGDTAALLIDRGTCPKLVQALAYEYRYRRKRDGQLEPEPEKLHPWSDLADAAGYSILGHRMGVVGRVMNSIAQRGRQRVKFTSAAWT